MAAMANLDHRIVPGSRPLAEKLPALEATASGIIELDVTDDNL
jgi:hypothetical protein